MAVWKEITGYEGRYLVSDEGQILSLPREVSNSKGRFTCSSRILKPWPRGGNKGKVSYLVVALSDGAKGKHTYKSVHRLVAEAFVVRPEGCDVVNHIDHDTHNNKASNLEWCTGQYNTEYSHNKRVGQYDTDGNLLAEYRSITTASAMTGIGRTSIGNALSGLAHTSGGYVWKYLQD